MSKRKKIWIVVIVLLTALVLGVFALRKYRAAYNCLYQDGSKYARCIKTSDSGGCYGYYNLRTNKIDDGIVPQTDGAATCEGIMNGKHMYFNTQGNLVR